MTALCWQSAGYGTHRHCVLSVTGNRSTVGISSMEFKHCVVFTIIQSVRSELTEIRLSLCSLWSLSRILQCTNNFSQQCHQSLIQNRNWAKTAAQSATSAVEITKLLKASSEKASLVVLWILVSDCLAGVSLLRGLVTGWLCHTNEAFPCQFNRVAGSCVPSSLIRGEGIPMASLDGSAAEP